MANFTKCGETDAFRESIRAVYDRSIWLKNLGVFPVTYSEQIVKISPKLAGSSSA